MRHKFQTEQWLPYPRERVFAFFADPANLRPLMPKWQRARVERAKYLAPPGIDGVVAGEGSTITISFRPVPLLPLRLEWDACIAEFSWNEYFCDEQQRGPFKYFHHCHRIRDERDGSVVTWRIGWLATGRSGRCFGTGRRCFLCCWREVDPTRSAGCRERKRQTFAGASLTHVRWCEHGAPGRTWCE
jgi:ligand-binding SRPBCC domain-containing protein